MDLPLDIKKACDELKDSTPEEIIAFAMDHFDRVALSFSGAEDVLLVHKAVRLARAPEIFTLDTGRLHPETYQFLETVRKHYQQPIEVLFPDPQAISALVNEKGLFSFYEDGHGECCGIRKVAPLKKKLATVDAWITGQRKDQSPDTRSDVPLVQVDETFSGRSDQPLVKFNPLANWSSEDLWNTLRMLEIPYNPLHGKGYISIGCEPCTRPVLPNQHEREGRWWWETADDKECGLHAGNIISRG